MNRKIEPYYKAYDKRYKQVHVKNLSWSSNNRTKIIEEIIHKYSITKDSKILEIGCGEGRDAIYLLKNNYNLLATDVSEEAINYCKVKDKKHIMNYQVLDVLNALDFQKQYDFIYSIACIHMLVLDKDRNCYYKFIYNHLTDNGIALILSLGDGISESKSNIKEAFQNTTRIHEETKEKMTIATTSCRIVSFNTITKEIEKNNMTILEKGMTKIIPDFPQIMYILIKKNKKEPNFKN